MTSSRWLGGLLSRHHYLLVTYYTFVTFTTILLSNLPTTTAQECTASACDNGLWSKTLCKCECITPFCLSNTGTCIQGGNCIAKNHWAACVPLLNCPWWKSITAHNSCATGAKVPAGIYDLYLSNQECCDTEFPQYGACTSNLEAQYAIAETLPPRQQPKYTNVPIKYSLSGLEDDVDMDEVKDEMDEILKQILASLAEENEGLDIGSIEENVSRAEENDGLAPASVEELYYDIKLLEGDGKEFSTTILEGLEDSSEIISEHMQVEANLENFEHKVELDPDAWEVFFENEMYRIKLRLADLPEGLDLEKLIRHIMGLYLSSLQENPMKDLDIIGIEDGDFMRNIVINEEDGSTEVFIDVIVAPKSEEVNIGEAIDQVLSREGFKNDMLVEIQSYTDLDWCIDEENDGAYAVCPKSTSWNDSFKLPLWLLITILSVGILLMCFLWFCIAKYCVYRQEYRNEKYLVTTNLRNQKQFTNHPQKGTLHQPENDRPNQKYPAIQQGPRRLMIENGQSGKRPPV